MTYKDELAKSIRDLGTQSGTHFETWVSVALAFILTVVGCVIFWRMQSALKDICSELGESTFSRLQALLSGALLPFLALSAGCFLILVVTVLAMRWTRLRLECERRQKKVSDLVTRLIGQYQDEHLSRISAWLHDEVGHGLVLQKMDIEYLLQKGCLQSADGRRLIRQIKELIGSTRNMAGMIYPHTLSQFGLASALSNLVENFSQVTHIAVEQKIGTVDGHGSDEISMLIFRIVQEALTNVAKHAKAENARVEVECVEGLLKGSVCNDGVPFVPLDGNQRCGIGIMVLSERAKRLGGQVTVGVGDGWSYCLSFSFPLIQAAQSSEDAGNGP